MLLQSPEIDREVLWGHSKQVEASSAELVTVGPYRDSGRMISVAPRRPRCLPENGAERSPGQHRLGPHLWLPLVAYQQELFARAILKYGSESAAAKWVAPPGHSEHHTGSALDIGDEAHPHDGR